MQHGIWHVTLEDVCFRQNFPGGSGSKESAYYAGAFMSQCRKNSARDKVIDWSDLLE